MITGRTVLVVRRGEVGRDAFNTPQLVETSELVENVLVSPATSEDVAGVARPAGDETVLTVHFPKTYTASLRGCAVDVDGVRYEIQGDPQPYMAQNTPGQWNRSAQAVLVEG